MSWFGKTLALILAALWLPMAAHCNLGKLPGLEILACCDHPDAVSHQDDDCQQDACAAVESGNYRVEDRPVSVPAAQVVTGFLLPEILDAPATRPANAAVHSPAPPELPRVWQFTFRAALLPRAPSRVA